MLIGLRQEYPNVQFFPYFVTPEGSIRTVKEDSEEALKFATQAHAGQERAGGGPYISHPVRVAQHVEQWKKSHNLDALISAAYLHDTLEDTDTTHEALQDLFGGLVASLVKELTSDKTQVQQMGKKNYLAQKMAAMSSYALVIKLADRLDNVRDITTAKTPQWRAKYAAETNHILDYIEKNRVLTGTHQKLIGLIRDKLQEVTNPPEVAESQLEEAFDQPYPWRWGDRSSMRMWTASFADVVVIFSVDGAGEWEISFNRDGSQAVTGEGDQFKIFATVIDIAKDFISLKRPKVIQFTAHKEETETTSSRTKLYSAMVNRFANSLGYESKEKPFNDFVVYVLTRKQDESVTEAAAKGTKAEAGYQPNPKNGQKCINCTMWRDPNKCSAVAGNIDPDGWCDWYAGGAYGKRGKRVDEDGRIVPGVNTTVDVKPGETERQAAKFGNKLTKSGPPLLMAETRYTAKEWAILEGGHALEEKIVDHAPRKWFSV